MAFGQRNLQKQYVINTELEIGVDNATSLETFGNALGESLSTHFPEVMSRLVEIEREAEIVSCTGKYARSIAVSRNLFNESHYDCYDAGYGASVWIQKDPTKNVRNWYFVLPNCSIEGSLGVAIRLSHGIKISWHGREVKHCTMEPEIADGDALFGCHMSPKKIFSNNNTNTRPAVFNREALHPKLQQLIS